MKYFAKKVILCVMSVFVSSSASCGMECQAREAKISESIVENDVFKNQLQLETSILSKTPITKRSEAFKMALNSIKQNPPKKELSKGLKELVCDDKEFYNLSFHASHILISPFCQAIDELEKGISPEGLYQMMSDILHPLYDPMAFQNQKSSKEFNFLRICYLYFITLSIQSAKSLAKTLSKLKSMRDFDIEKYNKDLISFEEYIKSFFDKGLYPTFDTPATSTETNKSVVYIDNLIAKKRLKFDGVAPQKEDSNVRTRRQTPHNEALYKKHHEQLHESNFRNHI